MSIGQQFEKPDKLSPERVDSVRGALELVISSDAFTGSKQCQDLLRLLVEHALSGEPDALSERTIGVEMFGRPVDYDTSKDAIVRLRATEVRKRLAQYYGEATIPPMVRIEIPPASYVPQFFFADETPTAALPKALQPRGPVELAPVLVRRSSYRGRRLVIALGGFALVITAIFVIVKMANIQGTQRPIRSIVVLPLRNLSGDPNQEYFADGMTEELIADLGQVSTLRVISRTSAMTYKRTDKKLPEIARELGVDAVVEGSVVRDAKHVRITAQLIDARNDRHLWAKSYVRDTGDIVTLQGDIAREIAGEITAELTPQEQARLSRKMVVDPRAQDLYLRGILLRENHDCAPAIDLFSQAIAISPDYAQAHSALATCYGMLGESGSMSYQKAFALQKAEAEKAIQLDDSISEAHAELANTAMTLDWDWSKAASEFRRALELNPNSAANHEKYAFFLVRTGHPEDAISEIERSEDLDPVSGSTFHAAGYIFFFAHQYDRAYDVSQTTRNLRIHLPDWTLLQGSILAEKHMYADSIATLEKAESTPYILGALGNVYGRTGRMQQARETISRLQKFVHQDGVGRYEIAMVYAGMGQEAEALKWLEEAFRAHDVGLLYLKVDPFMDPLRSDPRFQDLIRRVGLMS